MSRWKRRKKSVGDKKKGIKTGAREEEKKGNIANEVRGKEINMREESRGRQEYRRGMWEKGRATGRNRRKQRMQGRKRRKREVPGRKKKEEERMSRWERRYQKGASEKKERIKGRQGGKEGYTVLYEEAKALWSPGPAQGTSVWRFA